MNNRWIYLDRLKIVLTILVILHHASIVYGGAGDWFYYETNDDVVTAALLSTFTGVNQTFFMGLFFFISGYVTPASFDRKGAAGFLGARLIRFGVPMILYMLFIDPLLRYVVFGAQGSLGSYLSRETLSDPLRGLQEFEIGPLWYLFALLLFYTAYAAYRKLTENRPLKTPLPLTNKTIIIYLAAVMIVNFGVRLVYPVGTNLLNLQLGYFPAYIGLFMAGIAAYRGQWLERLNDETARKWKRAIVVLVIAFPAGMAAGGALEGDTSAFMGGFSWQAAFYAIIDPLLGLAITYALLNGFRQRRNGEATATTRWLSSNAFAVYVIHAPIVTYTAFALRGLAWHPLLKFAIAGSLSVVLCFLAASVVRTIPRLFRFVKRSGRADISG